MRSPGRRTIQVRDVVMARDCYDDCIAFLDDQLGRLLERARAPGASRQHAGDHHLRPRRIVRRSRPLRPRHSLYLDEIARPAGDPLTGRARRPRRGRSRQPARPAGDRGRPVGPLGRLAVSGPLAGGLLVVGVRDRTRENHARPCPSTQHRRRCGPRTRTDSADADSRCPW